MLVQKKNSIKVMRKINFLLEFIDSNQIKTK